MKQFKKDGMYDVIVIGAGSAGLLAANAAANKGLKVLLMEKMEKPARKLRITGKGRCNLTNMKPIDEFLRKIYPNSNFFKPAFKNFTNTQLIDFINNIGVPTVVERGDRVFPASQKAVDVVNALEDEVKRHKVSILCNCKVNGFTVCDNEIKSVSCETKQGEKKIVEAHIFILATGGLSYPATGSTGDGYKFAEEIGHTVTPLRPALTAIEIHKHDIKLDNLKLKNVELSVKVDGNCIAKEFGEMEFTRFGIDGAIVLRLSRIIVDNLLANKKVNLLLDLKPALSVEQLIRRIKREIEQLTSKTSINILLSKLLPRQFLVPFAEKNNIVLSRNVDKMNEKDIILIAKGLKCYMMVADGYRPFSEAIITAGGITLHEVNAKTMQSKLIKNLYFAGEILDLHADTGGYNLQIAFSTGYLAGISAYRALKGK